MLLVWLWVLFLATCKPPEITESDFRCVADPDALQTEPSPVYLFFADGVTPVPHGLDCRGETIPPAYACNYPLDGDPQSCATQIVGYLERWYADFNVYFTLTKPSEGDYDTVVITSDNAWCGMTKDRGTSPNTCRRLKNKAAFALKCGDSAKNCAAIIAHEHGHLVGLTHADNDEVLMSPKTCEACDVFRNADVTTSDDSCRSGTQNEYQLMCEGLKPRSLLAAPADALTCAEQKLPVVSFLEPSAGMDVLQRFKVSVGATDECGVKSVKLLDGDRIIATDKTPPYVFEPQLQVGSRTLVAVAEDNHGNEALAELGIEVHPGACPRLPCREAQPL